MQKNLFTRKVDVDDLKTFEREAARLSKLTGGKWTRSTIVRAAIAEYAAEIRVSDAARRGREALQPKVAQGHVVARQRTAQVKP